jgi:uncharacterized protein (DUF885 family)
MADADKLLDDWLDTELAHDPVTASALGLTGYDDRLGDYSAASFENRAAEDGRWAGRFDRLTLGDLPFAQRIDVTVVLSRLAGRAVINDWQAWRRDPSMYLAPCLEGVFTLFLHRLRPEAELVAASVARLGQVSSVLASARANLDPALAPRLLVERGLRAATAGVRYLRELLPAEVADERLRADLASAAAHAAVAVEDFASVLEGLAGRARGDWAIGEARYSGLLKDRELLGYGASEMHARGLVAWDELDAQMTDLAATVDPSATAWAEVTTELARDHPATPEDMRIAYEEVCGSARQFLVDHDLVTLPGGERCDVVPSPVFQRPVLAVASYNAPPPFSPSTLGHFNVPFPPDGASAAEVDQRLADNSHHAIPTTSVHEAYPGHHWQLTWSNRCDRKVRKVIRTPYFVEGWALYAERMMHEQGFFADPGAALGHLNARIFRAARIVVDTALHTGDMTIDQAVDHMVTKAALPPQVAGAEVDRYCAWPTQAASYLTGSTEIERIRQRWMAERKGTLKEFHDAVAESPGLPLALAELALFES